MKNTLLNMVLVLGAITLLASAGVGYVYKVTEEPIKLASQAAVMAALAEVLPPFDSTSVSEIAVDDIPVVVNTATQDGEVVGYAVETATKNGFSGEIRLMVGFDAQLRVVGVKVLQHAETPGLGDKMTEEGNPLFASVRDKNLGEMNLSVAKDGGDVDALTAATITSRAWVDAVGRAFRALGGSVDGSTGATSNVKSTEL